MRSKTGDFLYNGLPTFNINAADFIMFTTTLQTKSRIFTKNIYDFELQEYFKKNGCHFCISFNGIIIDLREYKNQE